MHRCKLSMQKLEHRRVRVSISRNVLVGRTKNLKRILPWLKFLSVAFLAISSKVIIYWRALIDGSICSNCSPNGIINWPIFWRNKLRIRRSGFSRAKPQSCKALLWAIVSRRKARAVSIYAICWYCVWISNFCLWDAKLGCKRHVSYAFMHL